MCVSIKPGSTIIYYVLITMKGVSFVTFITSQFFSKINLNALNSKLLQSTLDVKEDSMVLHRAVGDLMILRTYVAQPLNVLLKAKQVKRVV